MEYIKLGNTGLDVSKICLGCMSFGIPTQGYPDWSLPEEESRKIIKHALDIGINFFDTANIYSGGSSEEILGRALKDFAKREDVIIATKVYNTNHKGPNSKGLSRKIIMSEIELSLKRLQTDYVDLYIIHRWDETTPIEETMEALHDLVKAGKVHYIGASSMYAWQFAKAQQVAKEHGWTPFVSMQNKYNLFYREEEREMIPLLQDQKMAMTPYQPLAGGRLARFKDEQTLRAESQAANKSATVLYSDECENVINDRVEALAKKHQVGKGIISMAWIFNKKYVTSAIIGSSKSQQLDDALLALNFKLSAEEIEYLEEAYIPHYLKF